MGWDATRLSRVERGLYRVSADEVHKLADAYAVDDAAAVDELARAAETPPGTGWWAPYIGRFSQAYLDYIELEAEATAIKMYHPAVIPGLFQSPGYVRELMAKSLPTFSRERAEMLVNVRIARQEVLARTDPPVTVHALIPESALHAECDGGPAVMRDQVRRLLDLAEAPNITLQLVPLTVHPALSGSGAVTILAFRHPWTPVASLDNPLGGNHLEGPEQITSMESVFQQGVDLALPAEETRDKLEEYLEGMRK